MPSILGVEEKPLTLSGDLVRLSDGTYIMEIPINAFTVRRRKATRDEVARLKGNIPARSKELVGRGPISPGQGLSEELEAASPTEPPSEPGVAIELPPVESVTEEGGV